MVDHWPRNQVAASSISDQDNIPRWQAGPHGRVHGGFQEAANQFCFSIIDASISSSLYLSEIYKNIFGGEKEACMWK